MSTAFELAVGPDGLATLTFDSPGRPVNVFTREAMAELEEVIGRLAGRSDVRFLVLLSAKPENFVAGADIDEIAGVEDPALAAEGARLGQRLFGAWSELPFPTAAAVRGSCMGGGTELALASEYVLLSDRPDLRIGLPEVRIGILPAWGGCSRLPRRIGIAAALDLILAGKTVDPRKAFRLGLADALLPDASFLRQVREFAAGVVAGRRPARRRRGGLMGIVLERNPLGRKVLFDQARKQVLRQTAGLYPAPLRALEVVRVGVEKGLAAGLEAEARAAGELAVSPECKSLVHVFRLMEGAKRDAPGGAVPRPVGSVAVLGAGVMGGGIAQLITATAALPVRLKDVAPEPLAGGMAHAAALFRKLVERRRLSRPEALARLALVRPGLDYRGFGRVDLVIEAIVENLEVKQKVFAELAQQVPAGAILASNTSSLPIRGIARDTPEPGRVVGMHFFNPVHKMPLVEVIAAEGTAPGTVATVAAFARRLGKTPVVVKDGPGFLVNRLLMFYMAEALWLLDEGHRIEDLDRAMTEWGMPMGPMALTDEVGIDVAVKVAHILAGAFGDRLPLPDWIDRLSDEGRLGSKSGRGLYVYDGRRRTAPDPEVYRLLGLTPRIQDPDRGRLAERMVLPMVNEAARCLEEGVVRSAGDLDLALILGTGFPPFRGGLCRWADRQGLAGLVEAMARLAGQVGERFTPSPALVRRAAGGGFYAAGDPSG